MKIEDVLAPWEYDESAPPHVVSFVQAQSRQVAVIEEDKRRRVVFRVDGDDGSWTLTDGERNSFAYNPFALPKDHIVAYNPAPWFLEQVVRIHRSHNNICRSMFVHNSGFSGRVFLAPSGTGCCQIKEHPQLLTLFSLGRTLNNLSSSQVHEALQHQTQDPNSSFSFAFRFHQMSLDEKLACVFGFTYVEEYLTEQQNLEKVVRLIVQSEGSLWKEQQKLNWGASTRDDTSCDGRVDTVSWHDAEWLDSADVPYLQTWQNILRWFGPLQPQLSNLSLEHFYNGRFCLARTNVEPPTSHEQLEARLELRAWAKAHLPPDVQTELERLES